MAAINPFNSDITSAAQKVASAVKKISSGEQVAAWPTTPKAAEPTTAQQNVTAQPVAQSSAGGVQYDKNTDYQAAINSAVAAKDYTAAAQYEKLRNAKIQGEGLNYEQTNQYASYLPESQKSYDGVDYNTAVDYMAKIQDAVKRGDYVAAAQYEKQRNAKIQGEGLQNFDTTNLYSKYIPTTPEAAGMSNPATILSQMTELLNQWKEASAQQQTSQIDYATQQAVTELERALADAAPQYQTQRNQIAADERKAMDNAALYAEARGDRGGIGQEQYNLIQSSAAQSRLAVSQAQTKLSTDTARQIADLRAKGEFEKGVPAEEIAYIHTANSEAQKKELFGKVRSGQVRVLIGSTQKMGAGTNVQTKLAALHHLDCPWRPSDLQQREGRIIRQGNENKEVDIYTYVTENTFDSYLYQLVESKQKFIGQIMTSKSPVRSAEDIDETALSYAEIKALCAGNPHIKEKMDLDIDVSRLKLLKANHLSQRYALEDQIIKEFPQKIRSLEQRIEGYQTDIDQRKRNTEPNEDGFSPMFMPGGTVREKKAAGDAILGLCKSMTSPEPISIGQYRGFDMELSFDTFSREYKITLIHQLRHTVTLGTDIFGNIQRLDNTLAAFEERMAACVEQLENTRVQLENAKAEVQKPFPQEEELAAKTARLNELNALLNLDKKENEIVDGERADEEPSRSSDDRER